MNTKSSAVLSGVAALTLAVAILGVSVLAGVPVLNGLTSTSTSNANLGSPGTLAVLLTDPPHVPSGVTAVYVEYSDLDVHIADAGNQTGWTRVSTGGAIELLQTVNVSQTIAAANVSNGVYNALRFNVTGAQVTLDGVNYTAFVVHSELFVPIAGGGIEVNDSKPSATIIDISPIVMNIGSSSNPEFVIRAAARAFPVPWGEVSEAMEHPGFRLGLEGRLWWKHITESSTANLHVTSASLSGSSLNVSVLAGSLNTTIKLVVVSPLVPALSHSHGNRVPGMFFGSAVFVVEDNGSLVPARQFLASIGLGNHSLNGLLEYLEDGGFPLSANSSATFSYSGQINLGFSLGGEFARSVASGQQYLVTVIGSDALASEVVVAA